MNYSLLIILILLSLNSHCSYYLTLPEGVRNLTYRFIKTSTVTGSYNGAGQFEGYNINANINADVLLGLNGAVDTYLGGLSPADYEAFSFGTFEGSATSDVSAHAFGAGYGITHRLTLYGFVPFYNAVVDLNLRRTQKGRQNVGAAINLEGLPEIDIRIIQNLFVNYFGYQPLGKWEASGFGDLETGLMWNFRKYRKWGMKVSGGVIVPTGKDDNVDILQDINFGDGQWDSFLEFGVGHKGLNSFSFDTWARYTYQFSHNKEVRLPDSNEFPITDQKGVAKIKLGNKLLFAFQSTYNISSEWIPSFAYFFEYKGADSYKSKSQSADRILESNTEISSHTLRANLTYTTLNLYKTGRFFMPLNINLAAQKILAGKNTPKYNRYDLELQLFF